MFIEFPHYDLTVCVSIFTTMKDQKVPINHNLHSCCLLMVASNSEMGVVPLEAGVEFAFILPRILHLILDSSQGIAKG